MNSIMDENKNIYIENKIYEIGKIQLIKRKSFLDKNTKFLFRILTIYFNSLNYQWNEETFIVGNLLFSYYKNISLSVTKLKYDKDILLKKIIFINDFLKKEKNQYIIKRLLKNRKSYIELKNGIRLNRNRYMKSSFLEKYNYFKNFSYELKIERKEKDIAKERRRNEIRHFLNDYNKDISLQSIEDFVKPSILINNENIPIQELKAFIINNKNKIIEIGYVFNKYKYYNFEINLSFIKKL